MADRDQGYPPTPGMPQALKRLSAGIEAHEEGMEVHRRRLERDRALQEIGRRVVAAHRAGDVALEDGMLVVHIAGADAAATLGDIRTASGGRKDD